MHETVMGHEPRIIINLILTYVFYLKNTKQTNKQKTRKKTLRILDDIPSYGWGRRLQSKFSEWKEQMFPFACT